MSPPPLSRRGTGTVRNYANSGGVGTTDTARRLSRVRFYHSSTTPIIPNHPQSSPIIPNLGQLTTEYILCLQNIKGVLSVNPLWTLLKPSHRSAIEGEDNRKETTPSERWEDSRCETEVTGQSLSSRWRVL